MIRVGAVPPGKSSHHACRPIADTDRKVSLLSSPHCVVCDDPSLHSNDGYVEFDCALLWPHL